MIRTSLFITLLFMLLNVSAQGLVTDSKTSNARTLSKQEKISHIVISKRDFTLSLIDGNGVVIKSYGIACGRNIGNKRKVGDYKTPEGTFTISQIVDARSWTHDFGDGKGVIKDAYGPWFFRLKVPGFKGIGIHGTHLPESIGTRATEGCIRLHNEDVAELREIVRLGMRVTILPD